MDPLMRKTLEEEADRLCLSLSGKQLDQFEQYADLLVQWNEKMNLTAITDPEEIARKHFADSLSGAALVKEEMDKGAVSLADVGTGAGFPGVPLKILYPQLHLTLMDSLNKRLSFLEEVCRALHLDNVQLLHERAEEGAHIAGQREAFDIVTSRAVAYLPVLLEYVSGFVKTGGVFLAYKGDTFDTELAQSRRALKVLNLRYEKCQVYECAGQKHYVGAMRKVRPLPLQYPRKPSKIRVTPLTETERKT